MVMLVFPLGAAWGRQGLPGLHGVGPDGSCLWGSDILD
jgi:hypothetical protein